MGSWPKLAILADHYYPAVQAGGPPASIRERVRSSASTQISLITRNRDHTGTFGRGFTGRTLVDGIPVFYLPNSLSALPTWLQAVSTIRRADVVWINSLHSTVFAVIPLLWLGVKRKRPHILLSPRGELIPGHLAHHYTRKTIWHFILKALSIDRKITWLATTRTEAKGIRSVFPKSHIAVSPEVSRHAGAAFVPRERERTLHLLYLGRIAPLKGLFEAIQMIGHMERLVTLTVAGASDDDAYLAKVKNEASRLPSNAAISWRGIVKREEVADLIRAHDAMILPTTGESFGHSIAESLALGRPVLTTPTTPWNHGAETGAVEFIERTDIMRSAERIDAFASRSSESVMERQLAAYELGSRGLDYGLSLDQILRRIAGS